VSVPANNPALEKQKLDLRARMRTVSDGVPPQTRVAVASRMREMILEQPVWRTSRFVLLFAPLPDEPDLWPLVADALNARMRVMLPRFDAATSGYVAAEILDAGRDIATGRYGIREPNHSCDVMPLNRLDLALVPGVAFDARGGRLGRGRGYYDRLLAGVRGTKCGVAFDEQLVDAVPVGPLDIRLNCILTPTRWIET
jgi:5-formyltetrahydrofolate cyclo-ligase